MPSHFDLAVDPADLADARSGGARGQEGLYRLFERPAYNLARRMTGCEHAAWDVMQEAFLHAFARLAQFRGDAPFGHWLRSVVASEALMHLRAGRRLADLFISSDELPEQAAPEGLEGHDLEPLLARLDAVPRSVLWLYHVEGYTHAEIATMCGKTVSFSKSQLSRAHQKLREGLGLPAPTPSKVTPIRGAYEQLV